VAPGSGSPEIASVTLPWILPLAPHENWDVSVTIKTARKPAYVFVNILPLTSILLLKNQNIVLNEF